jgi:hypothetical protein
MKFKSPVKNNRGFFWSRVDIFIYNEGFVWNLSVIIE